MSGEENCDADLFPLFADSLSNIGYIEKTLGGQEALIAKARFHRLYHVFAYGVLALSLALAGYMYSQASWPGWAAIVAGVTHRGRRASAEFDPEEDSNCAKGSSARSCRQTGTLATFVIGHERNDDC